MTASWDLTFTFNNPFLSPNPLVAPAPLVGPTTKLPEELQVEAIRAYRWARLVRDRNTLRLMSLHREFMLAPEQVAECEASTAVNAYIISTLRGDRRELRPGHSAPDPSCACGFYGLRDRDQLTDDKTTLRSKIPAYTVELETELSGRMIVHEKGIRGQHQRILSCRVERACTDGLLCDGDGAFLHFGPDHTGPSCERCAADRSPRDLVTLPQLSAALGVEVVWS